MTDTSLEELNIYLPEEFDFQNDWGDEVCGEKPLLRSRVLAAGQLSQELTKQDDDTLSLSSFSSSDEVNSKNVLYDHFRMEFPTMTSEECYLCRRGRSVEMAKQSMKANFEFRDTYRLDTMKYIPILKSDTEVFEFAVKHALSFFPNVSLQSKLPRFIKMGETDDNLNTKDGYRITFLLPALIDIKIAPLELYALVMPLYFHFKFPDRENPEKMTFAIDVRRFKGGPNPSAARLFPFTKLAATYLSNTIPGRVNRCLLYPVPRPTKFIWDMFKTLIPDEIIDMVNIFWGMAFSSSPAPVQDMKKFFDESIIERLEQMRTAEHK
jgi:hypothetical protein